MKNVLKTLVAFPSQFSQIVARIYVSKVCLNFLKLDNVGSNSMSEVGIFLKNILNYLEVACMYPVFMNTGLNDCFGA